MFLGCESISMLLRPRLGTNVRSAPEFRACPRIIPGHSAYESSDMFKAEAYAGTQGGMGASASTGRTPSAANPGRGGCAHNTFSPHRELPTLLTIAADLFLRL